MITGRVTSTPEALLTLQLRGTQGHEVQIQAVLDTGFTDYLTLPPDVISELSLTSMDTVNCQLADGHIVTMESFEVVVIWHDSPRPILALAADGDPLIGMSLLYGSRVMLNVVADGDLKIEPID